MNKLSYLPILWLLMLLMACTSNKDNKNTHNTHNTQDEDYIINPPNFEELERKKANRGRKLSAPTKNNTGSDGEEDSLITYIKKFTHLFNLQESQMKAMEFILLKHEKKVTQLKAERDAVGLKKAMANNKKNLKQVLGDDLYTKKVNFDLSYNKVIQPKKTVQASTLNNITLSVDDRRYLTKLSTALNLNYELMIGLKKIIQMHGDALKLAKPTQFIALIKRKDRAEKKLLGDSLYLKKVGFDEKYSAGE